MGTCLMDVAAERTEKIKGSVRRLAGASRKPYLHVHGGIAREQCIGGSRAPGAWRLYGNPPPQDEGMAQWEDVMKRIRRAQGGNDGPHAKTIDSLTTLAKRLDLGAPFHSPYRTNSQPIGGTPSREGIVDSAAMETVLKRIKRRDAKKSLAKLPPGRRFDVDLDFSGYDEQEFNTIINSPILSNLIAGALYTQDVVELYFGFINHVEKARALNKVDKTLSEIIRTEYADLVTLARVDESLADDLREFMTRSAEDVAKLYGLKPFNFGVSDKLQVDPERDAQVIRDYQNYLWNHLRLESLSKFHPSYRRGKLDHRRLVTEIFKEMVETEEKYPSLKPISEDWRTSLLFDRYIRRGKQDRAPAASASSPQTLTTYLSDAVRGVKE